MSGEKGRAAVWIGSRRIKIMELPIPKAGGGWSSYKSGRDGYLWFRWESFPDDPALSGTIRARNNRNDS